MVALLEQSQFEIEKKYIYIYILMLGRQMLPLAILMFTRIYIHMYIYKSFPKVRDIINWRKYSS